MCERDVLTTFPIPNATALAKLNEEYKASFGSIRRCVAFFSCLPPECQQALCKALSIDEEPLASVEKVAKFLYDLRSKFVHEAQLVLQLRDLLTFSTFAMKGQRIVESQLSIETLLDTFEEGILAYFNEVGVIPR